MSEKTNSSYPENPHQDVDDLQPIPEELAAGILERLNAGEEPGRIDGYLGSGADKHAFVIDVQGTECVLKVVRSYPEGVYPDRMSETDKAKYRKETTVRSIEPLLRGEGVDGLEQLLGADIDRGLMFTTLASGKKVSDMKPRELFSIGKDHLHTLSGLIEAMKERGLHPHNAGSIFFDKQTGFNFVDYDLDNDSVNNKAGFESLEDFIHYALSDFKKIDELLLGRQNGYKVPEEAFRTTGLRAMARSAVIRRAKKLSD